LDIGVGRLTAVQMGVCAVTNGDQADGVFDGRIYRRTSGAAAGCSRVGSSNAGSPFQGAAGRINRSGLGAVRAINLLMMGFAYLAVGLLIRGATLGFPVIHIDEQFYLLVGDRMLHGAVPFVDIWDRKPIGLFILYAAIRLLGGDGILQYQLVALACVAGTSLVIYRMAREIASPMGAFWAGVAYQLYLSAFFCFGGQAPVSTIC
jgi:hypothetical protein